MNKFSKYLPIALMLAFFLFGLSAFLESKPSHKNERVYKTVRQFSPYYMEKRFGGLEIRSKIDPKFKEEPDNMTLFKAFEQLEHDWGQKYLKIAGNTLIITDSNGTEHALKLTEKDEIHFVQNYYGVHP